MSEKKLSILGFGSYIPPVQQIDRLVRRAGGKTTGYRGWKQISVCRPKDHPSTMSAKALDKALKVSKIDKSEIKVIIFCGVSRDYPASWSVSTEVAKILQLPSEIVAIDINVGCIGVVTSLEILKGWLIGNGGGYGAIVCAERWTHTIDRKQAKDQIFWSWADGAAAMVVSANKVDNSIGTYGGAFFHTISELNGGAKLKYGGTKFPFPKSQSSKNIRKVLRMPKEAMNQKLTLGLSTVIAGLKGKLKINPDFLVCNQVGPIQVEKISEIAGMELGKVCITGDKFGHVGGCDIILGLEKLYKEKKLLGNILLAGSTFSIFAAGMIHGTQTKD